MLWEPPDTHRKGKTTQRAIPFRTGPAVSHGASEGPEGQGPRQSDKTQQKEERQRSKVSLSHDETGTQREEEKKEKEENKNVKSAPSAAS